MDQTISALCLAFVKFSRLFLSLTFSLSYPTRLSTGSKNGPTGPSAFSFATLLGLIALLWLLGVQVAAQVSIFAVKLPRLLDTLQELPFLIGRSVDPGYGALFDQVYVNLVRLSRYLTGTLVPRLFSVGAGGSNPTEALFSLAGGGPR